MTKVQESPLLAAARALAGDLERFEKLSAELSRLVINSDKTLQRACRGLLECSEHEARLAETLRGFASAMQAVQQAQQRCLEQTSVVTERVRKRQAQRSQLLERLQLLSQQAREVSAPVAGIPDGSNSTTEDVLQPLHEMARRLELVIQEAKQVSQLAEEDEWLDVTRDTQALEQQLLAAKNRVQLSLRKLAQGAPS